MTRPDMPSETAPSAMQAMDTAVGSAAAGPVLVGRRILIIVENLPVPFDRRVWLEARTLRAAGAEVMVICPTGRGFDAHREEIEGIRVLRHPLPEAHGKTGYLIEYAAALWHQSRLAWKVFLRHGFDVIHGCNPPDLIFLVALQFRLFGRRFLFDHHDINPELFEAKFGRRGLFWHLLRLAERLTFAAATVSIATNESYRRIAVERGRMPPEDVFVVRSGPDLARIRPVAPNPAWRNGRAFLIGYVGVMGDQEGIDLFLAAMADLVHRQGRGDIQAVLMGGGPALAALQAMSAQMGLADYVTFTGRVPDATFLEVLSTADICVNPDRVNAMNDLSTMNKVLEYMALGKPLVQFDVTEGRVSAGGASLYARPNDPLDFAACIAELLADPGRRAAMGAEGRDRVVARFAWPHQVAPLLAAYQRLFDRMDGLPRRAAVPHPVNPSHGSP
jgi:glycosyltransferase involved in cell wall biosynthesis